MWDAARDFKWPPFFQKDEVRYLAQRISNAASDEAERQAFAAVLRRSYEDILELEVLYRELAGVMADDPQAQANFRGTLERAAAKVKGRRETSRRLADSIPNPEAVARSRCRPSFLIKPDRILLITQGAQRIAGNNEDTYAAYLGVVRSLWDKAGYLELLHRQASRSMEGGARDRLGETLRLIVRDSRMLPRSLGEFRQPPVPGMKPGEWPPPDSGLHILLPPLPGRRPAGFPENFCDLVEETCRDLVLEGAGNIQPLPQSTYATGISSVIADCQTISILGNFPATQPGNVSVIVGCAVAKVLSWTQSEIVVTVPLEARAGCVGFRDETIEAQRKSVYEQNQRVLDEISKGLRCLGSFDTAIPKLPYAGACPPCLGTNSFAGVFPEVTYFLANGQTDLTVEPQESILLTWQVSNTTELRIDGPGVQLKNPPGGIAQAPPVDDIAGKYRYDGEYVLTATNRCGEVIRSVAVHLRKTPALKIFGVEVVQAIQRFDLGNPQASSNNSVRLVAHKPTMVRVYAESGINDGFNNGCHRNCICEPVMGEVIVFPESQGQGFSSGPPLNTNRKGLPTRSEVKRDNPQTNLNFLLPASVLKGRTDIIVRMWAEGHKGETGWSDTYRLTVNFQPRRMVPIFMIRVRDDNPGRQLDAPTEADFRAELNAVTRLYPIKQGGFGIQIPSGFEEISTNDLAGWGWGPCDLAVQSEWRRLLDHLAWIANQVSQIRFGIWVALVPTSPLDASGRRVYPLSGKGTAGLSSGCRHFIVENLPWIRGDVFAHEMGHTFAPPDSTGQPKELGHSNCNNPPNVDSRLTSGQTEDIGVDVSQGMNGLIEAGRGDIMGYCGPPPARWPSIAFWELIFNELR